MQSVNILTDLNDHAQITEGVSVFAPAVAQFPTEIAMASLMLPLTNVNNETVRFLGATGASAPSNCYCGVFALDPFTNWEELMPLILNARFCGVCNFPMLPEFDDEENGALESSGYSYQTEMHKMQELSRFGLELLIVHRSEHQHSLAKNALRGLDAKYVSIDLITYPHAGGDVSGPCQNKPSCKVEPLEIS